MKYEISIEKYFSAAHALREYKGKCERLHGHNWRVLVVVGGQKLDKIGMLIDFSELKKILEGALLNLDHSYLNETEPFDKINPTAENIAEYIFNKINIQLPNGVMARKVCVWESEASCACVYGE